MPPEPIEHAERIRRFVKPVGVLLTERADVLARVYGVVAAAPGFADEQRANARQAVADFLRLIDP